MIQHYPPDNPDNIRLTMAVFPVAVTKVTVTPIDWKVFLYATLENDKVWKLQLLTDEYINHPESFPQVIFRHILSCGHVVYNLKARPIGVCEHCEIAKNKNI